MHARAIPRLRIHDGSGFVGFAVPRIGGRSLVQRGRFQNRMRQESLRHTQERGYVGGQDDVRPVRRSCSAGIDIHLGPSCGRTGDPVSEGGHLAQPAAQHQQRIRLFESALEAARCTRTRHAQVQRVVVREQVAASPGRNDGHSYRLRESHQGVGAASPKNARSRQNQRPVRIGEHMKDFPHQRRVRLPLMVDVAGPGAAVASGGDLHVHEIGRHCDQNGPGTTGGRHRRGPLEQRYRVGGILQLRRPLDDGPQGCNGVQLLERLPPRDIAANTADDCDERCGIDPRRVEADRQIAGSRTPSADAQGRPAGELPNGRGHERGGSFVPCRHDPNAIGREPLQQSQHALARHREGDLDAGSSHSFGQGSADRGGGALVHSQ